MLHIIQKKQQKLKKKLKLLKFGIMKKSKENTTFKLKSQVKTNL